MTAQDQQSRELLPCPFCGREAMMSHSRDGEVCNVRCAGWSVGNCLGAGPNCYTEADAVAGWNRRAPVEQAARALPASMKPVAEIFAGDLFRVNQGPDAEPVTGDHYLYTAAQVLAMLMHRGVGNEEKPAQTRTDAGSSPGPELSSAQHPCRVNPLYHGPSNCQMGTVGCSVDSHRGRGRPPSVMYGTQARTTGAAPAYRLLQRDLDTIQADDEFLRDDAVTWQADPQGIFVGMAYMSNVLRPARRAIESCPEVK